MSPDARINDKLQDDAPGLNVRAMDVGGAEGPLAARLYKSASDGKRDTLIVFFHGADDILKALLSPLS